MCAKIAVSTDNSKYKGKNYVFFAKKHNSCQLGMEMRSGSFSLQCIQLGELSSTFSAGFSAAIRLASRNHSDGFCPVNLWKLR